MKSEYIDIYNEELYNILISNQRNEKNRKKELREINKKLAQFGYSNDIELTPNVMLNTDFARVEMKNSIYD